MRRVSRVQGFHFHTDVKVRFAETDAQGVAHNTAYIVWFEVARVDYLARYAGGYQSIRDRGFEALVTETHVRYYEPARFDDRVLVHARCTDLKGARFRFEYLVEREDGTRLAEGWTGHAIVDAATFRPVRTPDWFAAAIASAEAAGGRAPARDP
jgi:acyl-CoA thioester hydrolase